MPSAGFVPATPATKRPQTYALDRAATGIGQTNHCVTHIRAQLTLHVITRPTQRCSHAMGLNIERVWTPGIGYNGVRLTS
jgi:hypothetical protein